jgi:hypothetical protein
MPAGKVLLQVVAHDGFRSVASETTAVDNAAAPPIPAILHPHPRVPLYSGETLHLWGSVARQPSSPAGGYRYAWTIDGKAAGDGMQVFTDVPPAGTHRCEFSVAGADGKVVARREIEFRSI